MLTAARLPLDPTYPGRHSSRGKALADFTVTKVGRSLRDRARQPTLIWAALARHGAGADDDAQPTRSTGANHGRQSAGIPQVRRSNLSAQRGAAVDVSRPAPSGVPTLCASVLAITVNGLPRPVYWAISRRSCLTNYGAYPDRALPCQLAPAGSSTADASEMRARPGAVLAPVDAPSLRTMSQTIIFHR